MSVWNIISLALVVSAVAFQYFHMEKFHRAEMASMAKGLPPSPPRTGPRRIFFVAMALMMIAFVGIVLFYAHLTASGWMSQTFFVIAVICCAVFLLMLAVMFLRDLKLKSGR